MSLKKFDATKWLFRGRKSKKDRQNNDNREINNSLQTTTHIPKDWATRTPQKTGCTPEE